MASGQKIAKQAVVNRRQTPLFSYIRNKLLRVYRSNRTPPPGLPTADGTSVYNHPGRFPDSQSSRDQPPASIPDGVHHKLATNYYLDRDGRRQVLPPPALYDAETGQFADQHAKPIESAKAVSKGPTANFGLNVPTPGFGIQWRRNAETELDQAKFNKQFKFLERYDRYSTEDAAKK